MAQMNIITVIPLLLQTLMYAECDEPRKTIVLPYACDYLDIMFVVDGSGSVTEKNFKSVTEWLESSVVTIHQDLGSNVQIGVLQFSGKKQYEIPFRLGECTTKECLTSELRNMQYLSGGTHTYAALNRTVEVEFPRSSRSDIAKKVIILITDGKSSESNPPLHRWYNETIKRNITTYAVGVGEYNLEELQIVANGGKGNESVYLVENFDVLPTIISEVAGRFCEDNDECELQTHNCSSVQTCMNFPGNYSCRCNEGFVEAEDGSCTDVNECERNGICGEIDCLNTIGNYTCGCAEGYFGENNTCSDIDECEQHAHNCGPNQNCVNFPGSFSCRCSNGFVENGDGLCMDVNECDKEAVCGEKNCTNTIGSYTCGCAEEYLEEESTCSECSCLPKDGYEKPIISCDDEYSCVYGQGNGQRTCIVPPEEAFKNVFNAVNEWTREDGTMTDRSHVMEKIAKVDEAIKCAAVATRGQTINREIRNIEATSREVKMETESEKPIRNFSRSVLLQAYVPDLPRAQMVGIQFAAPKHSVDLLLDQPKNNQWYSTLRSRFIYTEKSPTVSVSLYGGESFDYRENVRVRLEVEVDVDFADSSLGSQFAVDPAYWTSYVRSVEYRCMYVDTAANRMSESGCSTIEYRVGSTVVCDCNHTTMFAVLLSYTAVEIPRGVQIVSYVTECLSILFLVVTMIVLLNVRPQIRGDRIGIQISLALSLLFLHLFNALQGVAVRNDIACKAFAVIIHYFLLASGMWMLMEGITLLMKTNENTLKYLSEENQRKISIWRHAISWGVPFVIVLISAVTGFVQDSYMRKAALFVEEKARPGRWNFKHQNEHNFCWLSPTYLLWSVIVPMGIIILLNCVIIVRMGVYIFKMSSQRTKFKPRDSISPKQEMHHVKVTFRAIAVLLPVLGISWVLAFLTSTDQRHSSVIFMYVNAVVNGLQGVFLFFIYCVLGKDVRRTVKMKYQRQKSLHSLTRKSTNHKSSGNNSTNSVDKQRVKSRAITRSTKPGPTADDTPL